MEPDVPAPSAWAQAAAVAGLLFGGAPVGVAVARLVAPGSEVAQMVGFLTLPLALVTGLQLWLGAAIALLVPRFIVTVARREWRAGAARGRRRAQAVPPGHVAFIVTGTSCGLAAGLVIGLLPSTTSFAGAAGALALLGLGYGLLARALARRGLLPFPAES